MELQIFDGVFTAILCVAFPIIAAWEHRSLEARVARGDPNARARTYWRAILIQWPLSIVLFALWRQSGRGLPELGLATGFHTRTWIGWGVALTIMAALVTQTVLVLRSSANLAACRRQAEPLRALIPSNSNEARLFTGVSITAGICEEFLYRGYLIAVVASMFNIWVGVALSSLAFGLGHAYQGPKGIIKTSVIGLALAGLYQLSGSLWASMLVHAALDVNSGYLGRRALATHEPTPDARAAA
jgi:membrane protease YdiL (CAAX protease family)